jgi:flagellar FliL protein
MKKNILTVVIMAATVINLVLTIVLVFSVMPAMNKTSNLIDKVASVIDLEIEDKSKDEEYTMADLEPLDLPYDEKQTWSFTMAEGSEEKHYVQLTGITLSLNMKAEDFENLKTQISTNPVYAKDLVKKTITAYTFDEFDQTKACKECVKKLQEMYDTKAIVDVILVGTLLT